MVNRVAVKTVGDIGPCMACELKTGERPHNNKTEVYEIHLNRITLVLCPFHKKLLKESI